MSRRILVVSNFFPPQTVGGAEIVAFRQARAMKARGHQVVVLAGAQSDEPAGSLTFDVYETLPVYRVALRSLGPDLNFNWPAAARRLTAIVASHDIEVVHFHNIMGLGANLIPAARSAAKKCFVTLHDHWGFCFQQTRLRTDGSVCDNHEECAGCKKNVAPAVDLALPMRLRRDYVVWCLNQADQLLVPSGYLAYAYTQAGFPSSSLKVVSNGIELDVVTAEPKLPSPDGAVRFLWSGYLGEHKGIFVLQRALELLTQDPALNGKWQLTIAGDGHERGRLEKALSYGKFREHVRFAGRLSRAELLALLPSIDVAMLTSIWPENESVAMLEAIASGTAQIATRIGGNVGLVEHNKSGLLVTPNDPVELADTMRRYVADPSLATRHGERNRDRRESFDESKTIDELEALMARPQASREAKPTREPVVICGTAWPAPEVAAMINRVHDHLMPGLTPRFIWREWAHGAVWDDTHLVWLWDRHPSEALVGEALRRGIPVLAPPTEWAAGLARHYDAVILYRTYLEALATFRALFSIESLRTEFSWHAAKAAATATALASGQAFSLSSEEIQ